MVKSSQLKVPVIAVLEAQTVMETLSQFHSNIWLLPPILAQNNEFRVQW